MEKRVFVRRIFLLLGGRPEEVVQPAATMSYDPVAALAKKLGVFEDGVSPTALQGRIDATIKRLQGDQRRLSDFSKSSTRLFEDQTLADCVVRVFVEAESDDEVLPAKRAKKAGGRAGKVTEMEPEAEIKAHASILASRSLYFTAALAGGFVEGSEKVIDVTVASREDVQYVRLLIKLSYGADYTRDGDRVLDKPTLLHLLVLADGFEMVACVESCLEALIRDVTVEDAFMIVKSMPESLHGQLKARELLGACGKVLSLKLEDIQELWWNTPLRPIDELDSKSSDYGLKELKISDVREAACEALAISVGPLKDIWVVRDAASWSAHVERLKFMLPLSLEDLALTSIILLLRSPKLMLQSENECYLLAECWLNAQERHWNLRKYDADRMMVQMFKAMPLVHMTEDFQANVIRTSRWWGPAMERIYWDSVWRRGYSAAIAAKFNAAPPCPPRSRAPQDGTVTKWEGRAVFQQSMLKDMEQGGQLRVLLGVFKGYPFDMKAARSTTGESTTFALYIGSSAYLHDRHEPGEYWGVAVSSCKITHRDDSRVGDCGAIVSDKDWGWRDFFGVPWDELMKPGCKYLEDGCFRFKVEVMM